MAPYVGGRGGRLTGFAVAGRCLVWARDTGLGTAGQVVSFDVDTGATRVLAQAPHIDCVAGGGDLVVWAEGAPDGGTRVMGVRLGGGAPSVVALLSGSPPTDVYASGDQAAWRISPGLLFDSYLQTATLGGGPTASAARPPALIAAGDAGRPEVRR